MNLEQKKIQSNRIKPLRISSLLFGTLYSFRFGDNFGGRTNFNGTFLNDEDDAELRLKQTD